MEFYVLLSSISTGAVTSIPQLRSLLNTLPSGRRAMLTGGNGSRGPSSAGDTSPYIFISKISWMVASAQFIILSHFL